MISRISGLLEQSELASQIKEGLTKNSSVPSVVGGTLWADTVKKAFYAFSHFTDEAPILSPGLTILSTAYGTSLKLKDNQSTWRIACQLRRKTAESVTISEVFKIT